MTFNVRKKRKKKKGKKRGEKRGGEKKGKNKGGGEKKKKKILIHTFSKISLPSYIPHPPQLLLKTPGYATGSPSSANFFFIDWPFLIHTA